ncbi:neuropeptide-like protein C4orf48 homolog isoform X2 [Pezoporus wallicus]|uniref:neuropeptide-like protein C4orf48 homolog isoform X2 n=1 Tax=Pezoporus wallicus TaxID=35540 RepID=UPI00254FC857|nr:neuropeptide-like protein C4orf48 homolog isoform X2 [Pezoporus wallicus]XP_061323224.1 NELL2-interacting cell ontogeny regulator 1 isoform X2 [Pezoporus flaviventris]
MLRNAALVLLAVCSGHFKETITKTRERSAIPKMLAPSLLRRVVLTIPLVFVVALLLVEPVRCDQEAGTAIPAESRPCVDCHAFEFMQRALQDLKKTAYNLDTRTETLLLQVEKRNLCDCVTANLLN